MKKALGITITVIALAAVGVAGVAYKYGMILNPSPSAPPPEKSAYDFTMKNIDGVDVKLADYKGKVAMIVNTASKCGYTPQYEGLQATYEKFKDKGFVILGFPANNFMGQEPGTEAEIKEFCTTKYKVTFPMFAKISVKGEDQHPLFNFLTNKQLNGDLGGDVSWNFNKFLVDKNGKLVARFSSKDKPDAENVIAAIEKYLAEK
jgi:glutathione peroxidase